MDATDHKRLLRNLGGAATLDRLRIAGVLDAADLALFADIKRQLAAVRSADLVDGVLRWIESGRPTFDPRPPRAQPMAAEMRKALDLDAGRGMRRVRG